MIYTACVLSVPFLTTIFGPVNAPVLPLNQTISTAFQHHHHHHHQHTHSKVCGQRTDENLSIYTNIPIYIYIYIYIYIIERLCIVLADLVTGRSGSLKRRPVCVCVCVCVCMGWGVACVRVCLRACVRVSVRANTNRGVCAPLSACVLACVHSCVRRKGHGEEKGRLNRWTVPVFIYILYYIILYYAVA